MNFLKIVNVKIFENGFFPGFTINTAFRRKKQNINIFNRSLTTVDQRKNSKFLTKKILNLIFKFLKKIRRKKTVRDI